MDMPKDLATNERAERWYFGNVSRHQKPFVEIIKLTPEKARAILRRNRSNRNLSHSEVRNLISTIKQGRWQFNGASIVVDKNGNLTDGQHRCHMCAESNEAFNTVFVWGVEPESRLTTDQGRGKQATHLAQMDGQEGYLPVKQAVAKLLMQWIDNHEITRSYRKKPWEIYDFYKQAKEKIDAASG